MFADDTNVYLTINFLSDFETLQNDLNKLEKWEKDWSMEFNAESVKLFIFQKKKKKEKKKKVLLFFHTNYKLHNVALKTIEIFKYLVSP